MSLLKDLTYHRIMDRIQRVDERLIRLEGKVDQLLAAYTIEEIAAGEGATCCDSHLYTHPDCITKEARRKREEQ